MTGDKTMPLTGESEPSPSGWVREQVETYEQSGGTNGNTLRDTGLPLVLVTYWAASPERSANRAHAVEEGSPADQTVVSMLDHRAGTVCCGDA